MSSGDPVLITGGLQQVLAMQTHIHVANARLERLFVTNEVCPRH